METPSPSARVNLQPALTRLFYRMRREHPKAEPWMDSQSWEAPKVEDMPLPGAWGVVILHPDLRDSPYQYAAENLTLAIAHLQVSGQPRIFLNGWDEANGVACCVSEPIMPE